MGEEHEVVVIGAGQSGLATSWHLQARGVEHVVLERGKVGEAWRSHRWDSFRLLTPNLLCRLPGFAYSGDDPDGFMWRPQIAAFFEDYAASFAPPVHAGVTVTAVTHAPAGGYLLSTSEGPAGARAVVVATGGYQKPHIPALAARLDPRIVQVHSDAYRNPDQLPPGGVLVVGGGSSGGQIAEELARSGRPVTLALSQCAWMPRRYRGRDITAWAGATGYAEQPVESLGSPAERLACQPMLAGNDTGADLSPYSLASLGVVLAGRLAAADGTRVRFEQTVAAVLAGGEAFATGVRRGIDAYIDGQGIVAPPEAPRPLTGWDGTQPDEIDLGARGVGSVVWATGYRNDLGWVRAGSFDLQGFPQHRNGVSPEPGLYFIGLQWLRTRGSAFIAGAAGDAEHIVDHLASVVGAGRR